MAYLGEDASIHEIESELAFYTAVVESLNSTDEDNNDALQENQAIIDELLELWHSKRSSDDMLLATTPSTVDGQIHDSAHVVSVSGALVSPLSIRPKKSNGEPDQGGSKKRMYEGGHDRRPSPLPSLVSGYNSAFLQGQEKAERRAKETRDRERADADFARSLSDTQSVPTTFQGTSQSHVNPSGELWRILPSFVPASASEPSSSREPLPESVLSEASAVKLESIPGAWDFQEIPAFESPVDNVDSPGTSSDSLQEISQEDFEAVVPRTDSNHLRGNAHHQTSSQPAFQPNLLRPSQATNTWPAQFAQAQHLSTQQSMASQQTPLLGTDSIWAAVQAVGGVMSDGLEYWGLPNGTFPTLASPSYHPAYLGSGFNNTTLNDRAIKSSYHPSGRTDVAHVHDDPSKSRAEIDKLLANIRPDEELPAEMRGDSPPQLKCILLEHQKLGLTWLQQQEEGSNKGSILADDMGLGKTIQALALMVTRRAEDPVVKTNLIVAPVALLRQWAREINDKLAPGSKMRVFIYHGAAKTKAKLGFLSSFDVVLTTYGSLASEYRKKTDWEAQHENAVLESSVANRLGIVLLAPHVRWYRVILDEAQCIKNPNTKASLAVTHLNAQFRLCMTGTPMMNHVGDLYPLIRFLRISPFNDSTKFNYSFRRPLSEFSSNATLRKKTMKSLQILLKAILLRRNKKSRIDDKAILDLKPRIMEVQHAIFSKDEKEFYVHLEQSTQLQVNKYLRAGTVGKNYSNILVLLLRLRQACCHPHLIKDHSIAVNADISTSEMEELCRSLSEDVIRRIKGAKGAFECPICFDAVENPAIIYPCGHDLCSECFSRMTDSSTAIAHGNEISDAKCPECRGAVNRKKIIDYSVFEKIHLPEAWEQKNPAIEEHEDTGSDDDNDSDSDLDFDIDSQDDLDDFVVDDDEEIEYEESSDEELDTKVDLKIAVDANVKDESDIDDVENGNRRKSRNSLKRESCIVVKDESDSEDVAKPMTSNTKRKSKSRRKAKNSKKSAKSTKPQVTLAVLKKESLKNAKAKKRYLRRLRRDWISSAKIEKTMEILKKIRANDPTEKTIIFSQFTSLLDLVEVPIDKEGWKYRRYDGSMNANARNDAVEAFTDLPDCKVMLVSLKAGNAGLNLTCASQVVILDPFWNPFIEEQAIDRSHRIGQNRPVVIHRVLIADTVEDRIIALQEKKREVIDQALDESAARSVSRLGAQELRYLFAIDNTLS